MDRVNIVRMNSAADVNFNLNEFFRQLTTAFDGAIEITKSSQMNVQSMLEPSEIDVMKDLLVLNRQHEIYVRKLLSNLKSVKARIESHVQSYGEKLIKLHDIVQYRSAVPSVQIFPKFKELTDEWLTLHDLSYVLSQQSQVNNYLQHLSELCRQQQFDDHVHRLLGENQVETDHTRLQKRRHLKLESTSLAAASNVSVVQPPESNLEVECHKNIPSSFYYSIFSCLGCCLNQSTQRSTFVHRLNTSASAATCWRRAAFYCPAFQRWEQFCGVRKFMAFTASRRRSFSQPNLKSEPFVVGRI